MRLIEILFPASEYGTDAFFKEFELINSVILPLVIFDLTQRKPMMIISFDKILDASLLEGTNIVVLECITLADLLTNDNIDFYIKKLRISFQFKFSAWVAKCYWVYFMWVMKCMIMCWIFQIIRSDIIFPQLIAEWNQLRNVSLFVFNASFGINTNFMLET